MIENNDKINAYEEPECGRHRTFEPDYSLKYQNSIIIEAAHSHGEYRQLMLTSDNDSVKS